MAARKSDITPPDGDKKQSSSVVHLGKRKHNERDQSISSEEESKEKKKSKKSKKHKKDKKEKKEKKSKKDKSSKKASKRARRGEDAAGDGEEEDASLVKKRLEEDIAKNLAESSRIVEKINQSIKRVEGNTFQATIVAVDNDWNFVVIGAGEKSGLTGDSKLLIQRDGRLLGRLLISKLEPNTAVADVEPGSLRNGVALQAGDQVILESVSSN